MYVPTCVLWVVPAGKTCRWIHLLRCFWEARPWLCFSSFHREKHFCKAKKQKQKTKLQPGSFHIQHKHFFLTLYFYVVCVQCAHITKLITNWPVDITTKISAAKCLCIVVHHDSPHSLIPPFWVYYLCSTVASKNKLRQNDSVNNKGMQWQFCFVSDENTFIYISAKEKKKGKKKDLFELCYNIQYQYVLRLQKLCYYSECVSDHSYSNVL